MTRLFYCGECYSSDLFFFFKQKTAYEMRISDWSSDVCSSDLLAGFASFGDAVANARAFPVRTVAPWTETRDGDPHLCIPDDLGYPVTAEPLASAMRG